MMMDNEIISSVQFGTKVSDPSLFEGSNESNFEFKTDEKVRIIISLLKQLQTILTLNAERTDETLILINNSNNK